jgi:hypothetical protein
VNWSELQGPGQSRPLSSPPRSASHRLIGAQIVPFWRDCQPGDGFSSLASRRWHIATTGHPARRVRSPRSPGRRGQGRRISRPRHAARARGRAEDAPRVARGAALPPRAAPQGSAHSRRADHPHIATLFGLEEHDGVSMLVMELVEGSTLADRLRLQPPGVREASSGSPHLHRDLGPMACHVVVVTNRMGGPGTRTLLVVCALPHNHRCAKHSRISLRFPKVFGDFGRRPRGRGPPKPQ